MSWGADLLSEVYWEMLNLEFIELGFSEYEMILWEKWKYVLVSNDKLSISIGKKKI